MNEKEVIDELKLSLEQAKEHFASELSKIRTGRAHPSMVEDVMAEAYESMMPLKQLATISTPEPQQLLISPFDPNNIPAIASAIRADQALGLNPVDDGRVVRVQIPPLTEERRKLIVKQLGEKKESAHVAVRQARHSAMDAINKAKKDKSIGEDVAAGMQKQVDEAVNAMKAELEELAKVRESEIMTL